MTAELSALAVISEQITATGGFTVWAFWRRNYEANEEQHEELYLTMDRACQAAREWIALWHYDDTENDPEDGFAPPRYREDILQWFENNRSWTGGVIELAVSL